MELEPTLQFATDHRHERKEKRRNKKTAPTFCQTVANRMMIMIIGNSRQLQIEMHCHGVETFSAFNSFSTQGRPKIWFGNQTIPLVKCFLFIKLEIGYLRKWKDTIASFRCLHRHRQFEHDDYHYKDGGSFKLGPNFCFCGRLLEINHFWLTPGDKGRHWDSVFSFDFTLWLWS